ncbi:hypothetical protein J4E85_005371 [Alternaria conjuncta]|uniref:uncharacterized protein n=1 Tax=Alternaria conjuncta TaxID=181017 RepID=UPI00221F80F7|nr:uncharacterized protein J4E85_005371 [Alternaria conjuncta]KAI4928751.1 hypothetical protein J4E85_005371 [Alternaria conjuncta]
MATEPHPEGLDWLSGYCIPTIQIPYKAGAYVYLTQSWYYEFLQYRETVEPDSGTNQASVDWGSDTCTAGSRSSSQLDGIAPDIPADGADCGGSPKEMADALVCMGAGAGSHDMPCDDFSNGNAGVELGTLSQVYELDIAHAVEHLLFMGTEKYPEENAYNQYLTRYGGYPNAFTASTSTMITEQGNDRTLPPSTESYRRISESLREAGKKALFAALDREEVATEGDHVKGRRRGLPLLLEAHGGQQEIMTCYDTGTHDNHISRAKAIELGYTIEPSPDTKAGFQLPNGKVIKAVGQIFVAVQFAKRVGPEAASMVCRFNVFEKLASPILIGMTFLKATQTITKYTSRMVNLPPTWKRSLRLCAVGSATNQVACIIDGRKVTAYADTGSEIALISGPYARERGFSISQGCEELELADGSLEYTSGFADLDIRVLNPDDWEKCPRSKSKWKLNPISEIESTMIRFHVLEGLQFDVILDEEATDILNIFQGGFATILSAASSFISGICPIIHLRSVEASLAKAKERMGERTKDLYTSIRSKCTSIVSKTAFSAGTANAGKKEFPLIPLCSF